MSVHYKPGQRQDCSQIANWINSIGHGHMEYLLEGLVSHRTALQQLAYVLNTDPVYSFKNVDLAMDVSCIAGLVFSYHAQFNQLTPEMQSVLTEDRVQWMRYFSDHQVENSWYINTLGVAEKYQRQGIASQLLDLTAKRALQNNIQCLSLHVYVNNSQAVKLYESYGFTIEKEIDLSAHTFFISRNLSANILMKCNLS